MNATSELNFDRVLEAVEGNELVGFCLHCGWEHDHVDPDARGDLCEVCGNASVMGAEQILIEGV